MSKKVANAKKQSAPSAGAVSKQGSSGTSQNNTSASNNSNNNNRNRNRNNKANKAKANVGNQTTANQPQSNNVSNNTSNKPNNNVKSKSSAGSASVTPKPNIWSLIKKGSRIGIPIIVNEVLEGLNSTSPTNNKLLPQETLTEHIKNQNGSRGTIINLADMILNPMDSYYWELGGDWLGDIGYDVWSGAAGLFSDDKPFVHNVGATGRDVVKDVVNTAAIGVDLLSYLWGPAARAKGTYVISKAGVNNIWDVSRDFNDIKDYSYKNLGFNDYVGDSIWRGAEAAVNNLFSIVGENRDFYQRGRYALNEMLSTMAKDIENHKDKNSPEYKDLVNKFERFNNLAKFSDFYWATKKEMDASDLSEEDFLKSKNLTPEAFDAFKQNVNTIHNLGSNLALNERNGIKRSDYEAGHNYGYPDYTNVLDKFKKGLEGDNTDIDTDTLNAAIGIGTDVGKAIINKPVDNTTGTGTSNTANENTQSSLTPDYLTEFYKKFDKKYNYDPAKGRFNIWL